MVWRLRSFKQAASHAIAELVIFMVGIFRKSMLWNTEFLRW